MKNKTSQEAAEALLKEGEYGILSLVGDDGYPYGVPLNYAYIDQKIYFHCANEGAKLDLIQTNNKVAFCVVGTTKILQAAFTTQYESVIAFGRAETVSDQEKRDALLKLAQKYSPEYEAEGIKYIQNAGDATTVIRIDVEHLSGKSNIAAFS
jgi:nitroimidazol reductase NimA-like FMN-containing flavoprotein (pyridoxamine 5'-phosphate oxidase superfamily)